MKRRSFFKLLGAVLLAPTLGAWAKVRQSSNDLGWVKIWPKRRRTPLSLIVDCNHPNAGLSLDHGSTHKPLATIDAAMARCRRGERDVIIIAPGLYLTQTGVGMAEATVSETFGMAVTRPDISFWHGEP